jgi:hypothetical protein
MGTSSGKSFRGLVCDRGKWNSQNDLAQDDRYVENAMKTTFENKLLNVYTPFTLY